MAKLVDCGVDYFRATTKDAGIAGDWSEAMDLVAAEGRGYGIMPAERSYLGYAGRLVGSAFFGARHDSWMVQVSGGEANARWTEFMPARANVTRVDCQVTAELAMPCVLYLSQLWQSLCSKERKAGRPKTLRCFSEPDGVTGITIGSRTSASYLRIYDKGHEQGMPEVRNLLRWEVEAKAEFAMTVAYLLDSGSERASPCENVVRTVFEKCGVVIPLVESYSPVSLAVSKMVPSVFTQLTWLRDGVNPTVLRLIESVGLMTVLQALFHGTDGYIRKEDLMVQLALLQDAEI